MSDLNTVPSPSAAPLASQSDSPQAVTPNGTLDTDSILVQGHPGSAVAEQSPLYMAGIAGTGTLPGHGMLPEQWGPGSGGLAFNSMPPVGGGSPGLESYLSASLAGVAAAGMGQNVPVPINALNGLGGIALSPEVVAAWRAQQGFHHIAQAGVPGVTMRQFLPAEVLQAQQALTQQIPSLQEVVSTQPLPLKRTLPRASTSEVSCASAVTSQMPAVPISDSGALLSGHGVTTPSLPGPSDLTVASLGDHLSSEVREVIAKVTAENVRVAVKEALDQRELEETHSPVKKGSVGAVPQALKWVVWENMHKLLGLETEVDQTRIGKKQHYSLPDPLADNAEPRKDANGDRLYNPQWDLRQDAPVNAQYLNAVIKLTMMNGMEEPHNLPAKLVRDQPLIAKAAKQYFRTMKYKYLGDNTPEGRRAKAAKSDISKINLRLSRQKADGRRDGISILEKVFGKAQTVGIREVVRSPWQSEEHSSSGEAAIAREALRRGHGAGRSAWELMLLYMVLTVFARFVAEHEVKFTKGKAQCAQPGLAEDDAALNSAGSELSDDSREEFLERVSKAAAVWPSALTSQGQLYDRFRGPAVNHMHRPKGNRQQAVPLYKKCISTRWAQESPENQLVYDSAQDVPSTFTIFDLEIPRSLIPADDLAWLDASEDTDKMAAYERAKMGSEMLPRTDLAMPALVIEGAVA
ncbi:hypothetical protein C8Q70DRAFT_1059362 [Cubamyces menziesii]|nr:hypothetical protein C8Q70DRAFT_1059362 [Cubamyces menziesii]